VLTCSSTSSRNFSLGKAIGEGRDAAALMADRRTVAEGAHTAPVLNRLAIDKGIDMPIVAAVAGLLTGATPVDLVLEQLMARPPRPEAH
jgi:glycerol-3-phosphate dehydrogenase (NAD(P)+)